MSFSNRGFSPAGAGAAASVTPNAAVQALLLTQAFVWMFFGLLLTAGVAFAVQGNQQLLAFAAQNVMLLFIGQLVIVFAISGLMSRISATLGLGLFFVYAASLGLIVGLIVSAYSGANVASAFFSAAAMFGGAALYGYTTKRSLAGMGGMLRMALIGLIVAIVVNLFIGSGVIGFAISIVGVLVFTALAAHDVQRITSGAMVVQYGSVEKAAVMGALHLYIDFINIFLFMLRLMGGNRN
jgi:uncharacterized protein